MPTISFSDKGSKGTADHPGRHSRSVPEDLEKICAYSRKGLWGLLAFLVASAFALLARTFTLTGVLPAGLRELLGPSPPMVLIDLLMAVSTVSSLIVIGGIINSGRMPGKTWIHVLFRIMFYFLYFIADGLGGRIDAVFISGIMVLGLHHCNIWNYYSRILEQSSTRWNSWAPRGSGNRH